ncbi:MAG: ABC transporter permease [Pseudonocardiaceae bacterium]|nr:ABC transporter permease [Pseudonocardiaceae bacterium]
MSGRNIEKPGVRVSLAIVVGALVATVLGVLTFGAQATVAPDGVPLAVAAPTEGPSASALRPIAQRVSSHGGEQISWHNVGPGEARAMLDDKEVYGILELAPAGGAQPGLAPKVVVSGAINPSGTQVAQQALTGAAGGVAEAASAQGVRVSQPRVETVRPASFAGRSAPLAVSALSWIGCLAAGAVFTVLAIRSGRFAGPGSRLMLMLGTSVLITGVSAGFLKWWDPELPLGADVLGFLLLIAGGFAAVQGALLRLLGLRGLAILGPLYLMAPTVSAQVPELLNPGYRAALWSWTPFRFSTEGLRSLLHGTPGAPDVGLALWVLGGMLATGLIVILWPGRRRSTTQEAESNSTDRVVPVGVD